MDVLPLLAIDRGGSIPIEVQLSRQLVHLIAGGRLQPGDRLPPIRSAAAALEINQETVRSAYRRLADQGLVDARPGRGTVVLAGDVSRFGGRRGDGRSFMIGVIIPAFSPFYRPVFAGISGAQRADDPAQVLICDCHDDPATAERFIRQLIARDVDGIIVVSQRLPDGLELNATALPPIVYADVPGAPRPSVVFDPDGVDLALDHLVGLGHRTIGLVTPPDSFPNMAPLIGAFQHAASQTEFDGRVLTVPGFGVVNGAQAFEDVVAECSAVITTSDDLAFGLVSEARRRQLSVPGDLSVIAIGDTEFAPLLDPPLTTISLPAEALGRRAMELLRRADGSSKRRRSVTLPVSLTERDSCGPPHVSPTG